MPGPLPLACVSSSQQPGRLDLSIMSLSIMGVPELKMGPGRGYFPRPWDPGQLVPKASDLSYGDGIISLAPSPASQVMAPRGSVCLGHCSSPSAENGALDSSRCTINMSCHQ